MEESRWIDEARKLAQYRKEAISFLRRAGQRFNSSPEHAKAVSSLWLEADKLDSLVYDLLEEMNQGLINGKGEIDLTRGASIKPRHGSDTLFYECSWSLLWSNGLGVSVNLAVEPISNAFEMKVNSMKSGEEEVVPFPVATLALKSALKNGYAAETFIQDSEDTRRKRRTSH